MNYVKHPLTICVLICSVAGQATPAGTSDISFKDSGKDYSFEYSYPAIVNGFPALKKKLEGERTEALSSLKGEAKSALADVKDGDAPLSSERVTNWLKVTDLPNYLSLSEDSYEFYGGAHGMSGRGSIIWDKKAAKSIDPITMFTSKKAFNASVQTQFCDMLDKERSERRGGEKVDRSQKEDWTQACPLPSDYTILLGSSNGKAFNRMAIYVGPYGAGPYSEGVYEIDMPVTKALLATVKPAYRAVFAAK